MRRLLQSRCRAEEVMFLLKSPAFSKNAQVWPGTISYRVAGIADSKGMLRHLSKDQKSRTQMDQGRIYIT